MSGPIGMGVWILLAFVLISIIIASMWKKVPSDKAMIVTGMKKRVITGGGGLVIPLFERIDSVSLELINAPVTIKAMTEGGVELEVGALAVFKIKNDQESVLMAMEQFNTGQINTTIQNIKKTVEDVLEGKLREIVATLSVEEVFKDREKFSGSVLEVVAPKLLGMGLEVKDFSIKDISDEDDYLNSLGKAQIAVVKKNAAIAESEAEKEREIKLAENKKATLARTAELDKETKILLAETARETAEKQAEADILTAEAAKKRELGILANQEETERKRADADAAYEIQKNKKQKEVIESRMDADLVTEEKNVEITRAQALVAKTKEEQETDVAEQRAKRREQDLLAEVQKQADADAGKVRTQADADLYRRQKEAEAKKAEEIADAQAAAEKKKLEAIAEADAIEKKAKANAEDKRIMAEAEATAIKTRGEAEADAQLAMAKATEAQGMAEAKVIREKAMAEADAKEKLAEAYAKYGEAAMMEMIVKVLPEITANVASAVAAPIGQIDKITVFDSGNGGENSGVDRATNLVTNLLAKMPAAVKGVSGIDLTAILEGAAANLGGLSKIKENGAD
jgi:flotillin